MSPVNICPHAETIKRHDGDLYRQGRGSEGGLTYRMQEAEGDLKRVQEWQRQMDITMNGTPEIYGSGLCAKIESWDTMRQFLKWAIPTVIALLALIATLLSIILAKPPHSTMITGTDKPTVAQTQNQDAKGY